MGRLAKPLPSPSVPLTEVRHERVVQLRAEGQTITAAAKEVGMSRVQASLLFNGDTPAALAAQARLKYLRATATSVLPSAAKILNTIHEQAMMAIASGGYKAGLDALWKVYQERKDAEKSGIVTTGEPVVDDDDVAAVEALTDDWGGMDVE